MDKLHLATRRTTLGMVRPMFAYELWLEKIAPNLKRDIIYPEYYNKKSFLDIDGTEKIFRQSQRVALTRFGFNTIYPSLRKTKWYDNRTKKSLKKFIDKINKTSPNVPIMSFHDSILYAIGSQDDEKNKSRKIGTHVNDLLVRDHHIKSKYGSHFMVPIKNWNPEVDRFGGKSLENILRDNISEVPISEGFLVDPNLLDGVKQERKGYDTLERIKKYEENFYEGKHTLGPIRINVISSGSGISDNTMEDILDSFSKGIKEGNVQLIIHSPTPEDLDFLYHKGKKGKDEGHLMKKLRLSIDDISISDSYKNLEDKKKVYVLRRNEDFRKSEFTMQDLIDSDKKYVNEQAKAIADSDLVVLTSTNELVFLAEAAGKPVYVGKIPRGEHETENRRYAVTTNKFAKEFDSFKSIWQNIYGDLKSNKSIVSDLTLAARGSYEYRRKAQIKSVIHSLHSLGISKDKIAPEHHQLYDVFFKK
ncbi:hypothetical protein HOD20_05805 [archaeon]|mgnify:FL=1|jgi:hypothetical protein|nr:hypothetical protein [archaeon]MBT4352018.1 hypothetical protein [archaeon]MBT4647109.1 hypothetical protein [archaeon]MBT6821099.1 hypothetical protein [archaeon]MBT7392191.1 hypothetical protein [archaeon]